MNSSLEIKLQQTMVKNDELSHKIKECYAQVNELTQSNEKLNCTLRELTLASDQLAELQKEQELKEVENCKTIEEQNNKQNQYQNEINELKQRIASMKVQHDDLDTQHQELQSKYKILKKKLKREKDEKSLLSQRNADSQLFLTSTEQNIATGPSEEATEKEIQQQIIIEKNQEELQKVKDILKNIQREHNQINEQKKAMEAKYQEQINAKDQEMNKLEEDYKTVMTDKNDYELICQDLNNKVMKYEEVKAQWDEQIKYKDTVLNNQSSQMESMD